MKSLDVTEFVKKLKVLNREKLKEHYLLGGYNNGKSVIITDITCLVLPEGYYFNKEGITNEENGKTFLIFRAEKLVL